MAGKPSGWKREDHQIYYRTQPGRKHGARLDRYRVIKHSPYRKQITEAAGWESDGWTLEKVRAVRNRLQEAKRTGNAPLTLGEEREANAEAQRRRAEEAVAEARRQKTVADLWDRYSKEVVAIDNKPSTASEKIRMWKSRIQPAIASFKIDEVTETNVGTVVRALLRLDESGQVVGGKGAAGNLYRLLHHMFHKAEAWGLRSKALGNPLENVVEPRVPRRERLLTGSEIGALLRALDEVEAEGTEYQRVIAAIRVVILTGPRISEPLRLRWSEIDRGEMELRLTDTKSGFSRRPISAATLAVLDSVERMPGVDFVFRGIEDPTKPLSYDAVVRAFRRIAERAGVQNCTLHTIRHWFTTMTANSVSNARVGMALTGHKSHAAYMNYVHGDKAQARALADQLAALAEGLANASSNITDMAKVAAAK
jgi:integrase